MNNRSENAPSSSQKMSTENISEILDKMLKLQEKEKKPSFFKKTICIVASICVVIFVISSILKPTKQVPSFMIALINL